MNASLTSLALVAWACCYHISAFLVPPSVISSSRMCCWQEQVLWKKRNRDVTDDDIEDWYTPGVPKNQVDPEKAVKEKEIEMALGEIMGEGLKGAVVDDVTPREVADEWGFSEFEMIESAAVRGSEFDDDDEQLLEVVSTAKEEELLPEEKEGEDEEGVVITMASTEARDMTLSSAIEEGQAVEELEDISEDTPESELDAQLARLGLVTTLEPEEEVDLSGISLRSSQLEEFIEDEIPLPTSFSEPIYKHMVATATDAAFEGMVKGNLGTLGIEVKRNFADFVPTVPDTSWDLEQIALFKAKTVFEATQMPVLAEATGFEVAPQGDGVGKKNSRFRFNRLGQQVDLLLEFLAPASDPERLTGFRTVLCYYDGEEAMFETSGAEVAITFCCNQTGMITVSAAMAAMCEALAFEIQDKEDILGDLLSGNQDNRREKPLVGGVMLRERVLRDGSVLPGNIIDVRGFMDTMVDMTLMNECAKDLVARCEDLRPTKILTIATTGLVIAAPMAALLQVPVVYARKQRSMVMSDYHVTSYSSKTQGVDKQLLVSKAHITPDDRVLIVDDFLSAGSAQDALLRLVGATVGATTVGIAVLVEKGYEAGRSFLSGYDIPIESLAKVTRAGWPI
ncbi:unnamed protein product [Chrysoparadoxa australica]